MKVRAKDKDLITILGNKIYTVETIKDFQDNKMIKLLEFRPLRFNLSDFEIIEEAPE